MLHLTETDSTELQLDSYVMHIHNTLCAHCDSGERYGEMFEVWTHPTKTRLSGYRQLKPQASGPLKDLPITYLSLPTRQVMVCSDCIDTYQSPSSREPIQAISAQAWAETLKRKYTPQPTAEKTPTPRQSRDIPAPRPEDL